LNINGARVDASHVPALKRLSTHIEELGLRDANLSLGSDIKTLFSNDKGNDSDDAPRSTIRYLDLTNISSVTQMSLSYSPSSLIGSDTLPLEVIELGQEVLHEIKSRNTRAKKPEWVVKELGRRGWFVRQPTGEKLVDDGSRSWKMGARWWGMRKIPVVEQDVGGMYGYFMFKRS
jgi:hypothetical protein